MTRLINQNFEGTGYDNGESWSEGTDANCITNEDFAVPGTKPPGAGDQCLRSYIVDVTDNDAYAYTDLGSGQAINSPKIRDIF